MKGQISGLGTPVKGHDCEPGCPVTLECALRIAVLAAKNFSNISRHPASRPEASRTIHCHSSDCGVVQALSSQVDSAHSEPATYTRSPLPSQTQASDQALRAELRVVPDTVSLYSWEVWSIGKKRHIGCQNRQAAFVKVKAAHGWKSTIEAKFRIRGL